MELVAISCLLISWKSFQPNDNINWFFIETRTAGCNCSLVLKHHQSLSTSNILSKDFIDIQPREVERKKLKWKHFQKRLSILKYIFSKKKRQFNQNQNADSEIVFHFIWTLQFWQKKVFNFKCWLTWGKCSFYF